LRHIRNFSIIAHIDHGKSTLADRFIQRCGGLSDREMSEQVLTRWTSSASAASRSRRRPLLTYRARDAKAYALNLIDTPGHIISLRGLAFTRRVRRRAAGRRCCKVSKRTVANCYTAIEQGVEVVPVLNKIDLPSADPSV
jgi:GTP-binding protein LepA